VVVSAVRGVVCALLLIVPSGSIAAPDKIDGTLKKQGCRALGEVRLCFNPSNSPESTTLFVAGRRSRLFDFGWDKFLPYEIEHRNGVYRIKVGTPSRSDVEFFAYNEVRLRKVGGRFQVDRYAIATDYKCEGSPDIRMIYEFDLVKRTMTSVLAPPWSTDDKVHRFVRRVNFGDRGALQLSQDYFINLLGRTPGAAAIQRLCSA
jgi:hypothetical protein